MFPNRRTGKAMTTIAAPDVDDRVLLLGLMMAQPYQSTWFESLTR
jgi:hypothetical protein